MSAVVSERLIPNFTNTNARHQNASIATSHTANTFTLISVYIKASEQLDQSKLVREYGQYGLLSQHSQRDRLLAVQPFLWYTTY